MLDGIPELPAEPPFAPGERNVVFEKGQTIVADEAGSDAQGKLSWATAFDVEVDPAEDGSLIEPRAQQDLDGGVRTPLKVQFAIRLEGDPIAVCFEGTDDAVAQSGAGDGSRQPRPVLNPAAGMSALVGRRGLGLGGAEAQESGAKQGAQGTSDLGWMHGGVAG